MNPFYTKPMGLIPVLSEPSGHTLTVENWQQVGVRVAAFYLSSLLMKPGIDILKRNDLADFMGWSGPVVLNATLPMPDETDTYVLRSPYDGHISRYSLDDILDYIEKLNPNLLILPEGLGEKSTDIWERFSSTLFPFIPVHEIASYTNLPSDYGVYVKVEAMNSYFKESSPFVGKPHYLAGEVSWEVLQTLKSIDWVAFESNIPVTDALRGFAYREKALLDLTSQQFEKQMECIWEKCSCPTCLQNFSMGYLHHLLLHTPLLAHRLLAQHNAYHYHLNSCSSV